MVKYAVANLRLSSRGRAAMRVIVLLCLFLWPGFALAEEPTITVTVGDQTRIFTRDQLLARPDAATIQVPRDITYRVPLTYRAVPVASLLEGMTLPPTSLRQQPAGLPSPSTPGCHRPIPFGQGRRCSWFSASPATS